MAFSKEVKYFIAEDRIIKVVKNMVSLGYSINKISQAFEVSAYQVRKWLQTEPSTNQY